jgi:hypothetical protein
VKEEATPLARLCLLGSLDVMRCSQMRGRGHAFACRRSRINAMPSAPTSVVLAMLSLHSCLETKHHGRIETARTPSSAAQATATLPRTDDEDFPACPSPTNHGPWPPTLLDPINASLPHHLHEYTTIVLQDVPIRHSHCFDTWMLSWTLEPPATQRDICRQYMGPYFSY